MLVSSGFWNPDGWPVGARQLAVTCRDLPNQEGCPSCVVLPRDAAAKPPSPDIVGSGEPVISVAYRPAAACNRIILMST